MRRRVVIGTNVYVSRYLQPTGVAGKAFERIFKTDLPLISRATLLELRAVVSRVKFHKFVDPIEIEPFLEFVQTAAEPVASHSQIRACRDPREYKFLELAVDGNAHLIVTGDQDLLILNPFRGITILTPSEYLARTPTPKS
jgi:putative PIN family toxin of toxin-antitoxin system